jgi:two-component system, OmpR family, KDP operon response regulator KdpE
VDRFGIDVPSDHPTLGGATRILIIDDDPQSNPPAAAQAADAGAPDQGDGDERPVVHEYQIATPLPGEVMPARESVGDMSENGHSNTSTVRELIARVEELLHRTRQLPAAASSGWAGTIQFGSVLLEPATRTVLRSGEPVKVTHTEFRLLLALIRRRGAIASRIELLREVWGAGAAVSRRAVDTHIARLRRKLEDDPANPRHILTALAWGYRFRP